MLQESVDDRLPNLELRRFTSNASETYRDARVMLTPYTETQESARPRSILEAQDNGIPVVGTDTRGLIEAIGDGGRVVPRDAAIDVWVDVLRDVWDEHAQFGQLARRHSARPDMDRDGIVNRFLDAIDL